jgi:hypothetical protein
MSKKRDGEPHDVITKLEGSLEVRVTYYGDEPWAATLHLHKKGIAHAFSGKMLKLAAEKPIEWAQKKISERVAAINKEREYLKKKVDDLERERNVLGGLSRANF